MYNVNLRNLLIIFLASLISSLIITIFYNVFPPKNFEIHAPHGFNEVIERNYDGPIYVVLAKSLYDKLTISSINFNKLPPGYYANHFPLFPLLIRISSLIFGNYYRSLILVTWFFSAAYAIAFYYFLINLKITKYPLLLSLISLFIPPRSLAVRTVGGTEPLFIFLLIICLYFWLKKRYLISMIIGILLVLVRPPGFYLFFVFISLCFWDWHQQHYKFSNLVLIIKNRWPLILMPLTLLGLFIFYQHVFGDFWAYFKTGTGTNIHFRILPFASVLESNTPAVEGFIYLFLVYLIGIYSLWKQGLKEISIFSLVYLLPNIFMNVDDVHRYLLPIAPFCLAIGYQSLFRKKVFYYFFTIYLIGVYIYTLSLLPRRMFHYWDYANLRILVNRKF